MTLDEKQKLKALFVATGLYFGQDIADAALGLYVQDLEDIPFWKVADALREIRRDPKTTRCPLPSVIRARACPETDPESEAIEAVGRIVQAISRVGPYRWEDAKSYIGELGWMVVSREGGWENICQVLTEDNMGTLKAQWRQSALAYQKRARAGATGAPELPEPGKQPAVLDMARLLPSMPKDSA